MPRDLFAEMPQESTQASTGGKDLFAQPSSTAQTQPSSNINQRKLLLLNELQKRGTLPSQSVSTMGVSQGAPFKPSPVDTSSMSPRDAAMAELASETPWLEALGVSIGKGFGKAARGLNLGPEFGDFGNQGDENVDSAMKALGEEYPKTTMVGEAIGEAAPFVPAAVTTGGISSLPLRATATGLVTGVEGAALADDKTTGALVGSATGFGAELLFPVIGKLGRKIFQRVTGRTTAAPILTAEGVPTPEFQEALDAADISFEDLKFDAIEFLRNQKPGADPEQVARATRFTQGGIPLSKGDVTQDFTQQATEQRLLSSVTGDAAEPFRQFKLKQSQAIEDVLTDIGGEGFGKEATGERIKDVLTNRKKMLRTQKNAFYEEAATLADENGLSRIPILADGIDEVLPDARKLRNLNRASKGSVDDGMEILMEYGLVPPTDKMVEAGFEPTLLTVENFDDLQQSLKFLIRGDQSGASNVAFSNVIDLVEKEADELATTLAQRGDVPEAVLAPLKKARETTRTLKTEFAPQDIAEKMIATKKNGGVAQVTEASAVYDKLMGAGSKVEDARRVVKLLRKSGQEGDEALGALQSTVIMDLLDAGFTTKSRKIAGQNVFNPIAFQNRLAKISKDGKLEAIFGNNKVALNKIKNLDKIATDLTPPSDSVPKGSAPIIMDMMNNLAVSKIPGGNFLLGLVKQVSEPIKTGRSVSQAMKSAPSKLAPEVIQPKELTLLLERQFPALASALGIATIADNNEVNQ